MNILDVYYWYVKMLRCGCVEHGLEYFSFYVQKHIELLVACSGPSLVRNGPLGAPASLILAYSFYVGWTLLKSILTFSKWLPMVWKPQELRAW